MRCVVFKVYDYGYYDYVGEFIGCVCFEVVDFRRFVRAFRRSFSAFAFVEC